MQLVFLRRSSAEFQRGGGMTQFCALFLHIYALLAPQRGEGMAPCPPKYAPDYTQIHYNDVAITLYNIEKLCH